MYMQPVKCVLLHLGNSETVTLLPGDKQIKFTGTTPIQRITIAGDCNLDSRDFSISSSSRVYVTFSHC